MWRKKRITSTQHGYTVSITSRSFFMAQEKKNFALRLDSDMYKALEKWAADEFRSINGQIEYLLDKALKDAKRSIQTKSKKDK